MLVRELEIVRRFQGDCDLGPQHSGAADIIRGDARLVFLVEKTQHAELPAVRGQQRDAEVLRKVGFPPAQLRFLICRKLAGIVTDVWAWGFERALCDGGNINIKAAGRSLACGPSQMAFAGFSERDKGAGKAEKVCRTHHESGKKAFQPGSSQLGRNLEQLVIVMRLCGVKPGEL